MDEQVRRRIHGASCAGGLVHCGEKVHQLVALLGARGRGPTDGQVARELVLQQVELVTRGGQLDQRLDLDDALRGQRPLLEAPFDGLHDGCGDLGAGIHVGHFLRALTLPQALLEQLQTRRLLVGRLVDGRQLGLLRGPEGDVACAHAHDALLDRAVVVEGVLEELHHAHAGQVDVQLEGGGAPQDLLQNLHDVAQQLLHHRHQVEHLGVCVGGPVGVAAALGLDVLGQHLVQLCSGGGHRLRARQAVVAVARVQPHDERDLRACVGRLVLELLQRPEHGLGVLAHLRRAQRAALLADAMQDEQALEPDDRGRRGVRAAVALGGRLLPDGGLVGRLGEPHDEVAHHCGVVLSGRRQQRLQVLLLGRQLLLHRGGFGDSRLQVLSPHAGGSCVLLLPCRPRGGKGPRQRLRRPSSAGTYCLSGCTSPRAGTRRSALLLPLPLGRTEARYFAGPRTRARP
eukprot:scaffold67_cov338-Prasinococcus_capsulatus_cf.AAC.1